MKTYTEQDLRLAFQAGSERGAFIHAGNYFDAPLDEDEFRLCNKAWLKQPNTENMLEEFEIFINKNL